MQTTDTMTGQPVYDLGAIRAERVVEHLRNDLADGLPHLSCTVEIESDTIYVKAVQA